MFSSLAPGMPFGMRAVFANLWLFGGLVKKKLSADPKTNALYAQPQAPTIFHAGVKENILASEARAVVNYGCCPVIP
jgi:carboxypeptidase PM20D1